MSDKQAVVEQPKVEATPSPEVSSAPDDLDTLLKEFETGTKPKVESPKTDDDPLRQWAMQKMSEEQRTLETKDEKEAISFVKGTANDPDWAVWGFMNDMARNDPRIANAWSKRHENPSAWKSAQKILQKAYQTEVSNRVDPQATQDRETVVAAVRGASSTKPEPEKTFNESAVRRMSHAELLQNFPELSRNF